MRQLIKIFTIPILLTIMSNPTFARAISGNIEYRMPIDYSKISQEELLINAGLYYQLAINSASSEINEYTTSALNLYRILTHISPDCNIYQVKLGTLYDLINRDTLAKSCLYHAIELDPKDPEAYFRLGEYYYKRTMYRKALKNYQIALNKGYHLHYETLCRLGDIYTKFGDSKSALKFLNLANKEVPSEKINEQIKKIQSFDESNQIFYTNRPNLELREETNQQKKKEEAFTEIINENNNQDDTQKDSKNSNDTLKSDVKIELDIDIDDELKKETKIELEKDSENKEEMDIIY